MERKNLILVGKLYKLYTSIIKKFLIGDGDKTYIFK